MLKKSILGFFSSIFNNLKFRFSISLNWKHIYQLEFIKKLYFFLNHLFFNFIMLEKMNQKFFI